MIAIGRLALLGILVCVVVPQPVRCEPIRIGAEAVVRENPRSRYSRYVNWRPSDGETVNLNPPRITWPYSPDWPDSWRSDGSSPPVRCSS